MDAVTIGAVAALLTAAAGLAKILASKDTEKPWVVGVVTLGIVGGVLLLVGRSPPPPPPPSPAPAPAPAPAPSPSLQEYQRQVRAVCAEDREAEVGFKHRTPSFAAARRARRRPPRARDERSRFTSRGPTSARAPRT